MAGRSTFRRLREIHGPDVEITFTARRQRSGVFAPPRRNNLWAIIAAPMYLLIGASAALLAALIFIVGFGAIGLIAWLALVAFGMPQGWAWALTAAFEVSAIAFVVINSRR